MMIHGLTVGGKDAVGDGQSGRVDFDVLGGWRADTGKTSALGVGGVTVMGERGCWTGPRMVVNSA